MMGFHDQKEFYIEESVNPGDINLIKSFVKMESKLQGNSDGQ